MKLLVTGATGFLGGALVPLLVEEGHQVRVLARGGAPDAEALGCELSSGDVRDPETVRRALHGCEGLYHLAGLVSRDPRDAISFVDVRDTARAFVAALNRGNVGERHLLGAANWEFSEFFGRLSRLARRSPPPLRLPSAVKVAAAHLMEGWAHRRGREPGLPAADVEMGEHWFFIDSSKAERLLSFSPRDPMETLAETISYVRERFLPREARS